MPKSNMLNARFSEQPANLIFLQGYLSIFVTFSNVKPEAPDLFESDVNRVIAVSSLSIDMVSNLCYRLILRMLVILDFRMATEGPYRCVTTKKIL